MQAASTPPVVGDEAVFLVGRPPLQEFVDFVKVGTVGGQLLEGRALADEWRRANDHIQDLVSHEAGLADDVPTDDLPLELQQLGDEVLNNPMTRRAFGLLPVDIRLVQLDRLIVFQKFINLRYVRELQQQLGEDPTPEQVLRFCLSVSPALPPVPRQQLPNGWVFQSPSQDFRFLDAKLIEPAEIQGYVSSGFPAAVVALVVGYGSNFLQVVAANGRLVLGNGSHRAYALRERGLKQVPALVQTVSRRDELPATQLTELAEKPDLFLTAPRPPLLKDYFDPGLRKLITVPRSLKQVRIAFAVEPTIAPA